MFLYPPGKRKDAPRQDMWLIDDPFFDVDIGLRSNIDAQRLFSNHLKDVDHNLFGCVVWASTPNRFMMQVKYEADAIALEDHAFRFQLQYVSGKPSSTGLYTPASSSSAFGFTRQEHTAHIPMQII